MPDPRDLTSPWADLHRDQPTRLSASRIWQLHRNYFQTAGPDAWRLGDVPYEIISGTWMAEAQAALALGFLRDLARRGEITQPFHILELGAGSGTLAFRFLKSFSRLLEHSSLRGIPFRYVLSDFADADLDFLREHPQLQEFFERGVLALARYDLEHDARPILLDGTPLADLEQPPCILAHYVFDSLPQDAFRAENGKLEELEIEFLPPIGGASHLQVEDLDACFYAAPARRPYYGEPLLDAVLDGCRASHDGKDFLFPAVALRAVDRLRRLSPGGAFFSIADKGVSRVEQIDEDMLHLVVHGGAISMNVDLTLIESLARRLGGEVLPSTGGEAHISHAAFALGDAAREPAETRLAFDTFLVQDALESRIVLGDLLAGRIEAMDLEELIAYLGFSRWDSTALHDCASRLRRLARQAEPGQVEEIRRIVGRTRELHFRLDAPIDAALEELEDFLSHPWTPQG